MNKNRQKLKFGFYLLSMIMSIISLVMICKTLENVDYISKTLKQRKTTVVQLQELYSELEPFFVAKQQLLSESEKRDISDINTILNDLNIPYTVNEDDSIQRENVSFITQTVIINNMKLSDLKTLMDNLIHEWPYINLQRVQISSTDNENANLKIKLVFTKVL